MDCHSATTLSRAFVSSVICITAFALAACGARPHYVMPIPTPSTPPADATQIAQLGPLTLLDLDDSRVRQQYIGGRFSEKKDLAPLRQQFEKYHWNPLGSTLCDMRQAIETNLTAVGFSIPDHLRVPTGVLEHQTECPRRFSAASAAAVADAFLTVRIDDVAMNRWSRGLFAPQLDLELRLSWFLLSPEVDGNIQVDSVVTFGRGSKNSRDFDVAMREALQGAAHQNVEQLLRHSTFLSSLQRLRRSPDDRLTIATEIERRIQEAAERRLAEEAARTAAAREAAAAERRRQETEAEERRQAAEQARAAEEAAAAARWRRPSPLPGQLVQVEPSDQLTAPGTTVFEKARRAVVTLYGDAGTGTGFIVSKDGLALTNQHVVDGSRTIRAIFSDGREAPVRVLRADPNADVALIQVLCTVDCYTAAIARHEPIVGTDIYVLGAPRGLGFSLTGGIVSAIRLLDGITYLQTDAAANPGNSGGPMLDRQSGLVYGIVTFKRRDSEGLSFALAVQDAMRIVGLRIR